MWIQVLYAKIEDVILSSWISHHVVHRNPTDVSEEHVASIFRNQHEADCYQLHAGFLLSLRTLKMAVICYSEMSADFQRDSPRYIPEDETPCNHYSENLKYYKIEGILLRRLQPNYCHRDGSSLKSVSSKTLKLSCQLTEVRLRSNKYDTRRADSCAFKQMISLVITRG
jgi:hypothetical protein